MHKKILAPTTFDHGVSSNTLDIANMLTEGHGEIIAMYVCEAPQGSVQAFVDNDAQTDRIAYAKAELASKAANLDRVNAKLGVGQRYGSIIDDTAEQTIDGPVMGPDKPGFCDDLLGATAIRVVRHVPCAVPVHRN